MVTVCFDDFLMAFLYNADDGYVNGGGVDDAGNNHCRDYGDEN